MASRIVVSSAAIEIQAHRLQRIAKKAVNSDSFKHCHVVCWVRDLSGSESCVAYYFGCRPPGIKLITFHLLGGIDSAELSERRMLAMRGVHLEL